MTDGGPVDRHLDLMFDRLGGTGSAGRRMLAEAEDHLRSAAEEARARGLDDEAAEREAVARFGRRVDGPGLWPSVRTVMEVAAILIVAGAVTYTGIYILMVLSVSMDHGSILPAYVAIFVGGVWWLATVRRRKAGRRGQTDRSV